MDDSGSDLVSAKEAVRRFLARKRKATTAEVLRGIKTRRLLLLTRALAELEREGVVENVERDQWVISSPSRPKL